MTRAAITPAARLPNVRTTHASPSGWVPPVANHAGADVCRTPARGLSSQQQPQGPPPMEPLRIATGNYGLTRPLKQGEVKTNLAFEFVEVPAITTDGMRPMVRSLAFDVCEMAFTTYLCARAAGKPITAIPVFLTRNFHHWAAFTNVNSGIKSPKDLEGRQVGVNRGYTVTTGVWVRGILQHEYGVDLGKITWMPTDEEHVAEFKPPANVDHRYLGKPIAELLKSGTLGAAVGDIRADSPDIRPLIPDARQAGFAYYRKTGIYPVNHGLVVKNSLLEARPSLAEELFHAFAAAKDIYLTVSYTHLTLPTIYS